MAFVLLLLLVGFGAWSARRQPWSTIPAHSAKVTDASAPVAPTTPAPLRVAHLSDERAERPHPFQANTHVEPSDASGSPDEDAGPFNGLTEAQVASLRARDAKVVEALPEGAMASIVAGLENELLEKGGLYGYTSRAYGATLESGWVDFAATYSIRGLGSPGLSYALETVKVGDRIIAEGGSAEPRVRAERRTVWYARGGDVEEEYALRPDAMEQSFIVKSLPEGRGAITVTGRVSTNLEPPADGTTGPSLAFSRGDQGLLTMSEAVAIDADGRRQTLELAYQDGRVSMTVPAGWVASATLPIVIDPLVGSPFTVLSTPDPNGNLYELGLLGNHGVRMTDVAYSPATGTWFVVWTQRYGAGGYGGRDYDVRGQRITAEGALAGGVIGISTDAKGAYEPCVAHSSGGAVDRYLIAFRYDPDIYNSLTSDQGIWAKVHGGDGVFVTPFAFQVENMIGQDFAPSAAYDGAQWYLSWSNKYSSSDFDIRGRFIGNGGTLGALAHPDLEIPADVAYAAGSSVAFANGVYLIAWEKGTSSTRGLSARTLLPNGSFLSPITTVQTSAGMPREVDVAGGGSTFLLAWRNVSNNVIQGRVVDASPAGPLTFATASFDVMTGMNGRQMPRVAYSTTDAAYLAVYAEGFGASANVKGHKVTPSGVVSAAELIAGTGTQEFRPELAWNSATNEFLVVYTYGSGTPFQVRGQRYSLGTAPPPAPAGLAAAGIQGGVQLSWSASAGANSYTVKRSDVSGGPYGIAYPGIGAMTFDDLSVTAGGTYYYVVTASNGSGESGTSNEAVGTVPPPAPANPQAASGDAQAFLSWDPSAGATSYAVARSTTSGGPYDVVAPLVNGTSYLDVGLANGTRYYYIVTAANAGGSSLASLEVFADPLPPPPAPPTGLVAMPGPGSVALSWSSAPGATTYTVRRSTSPAGPFDILVSGISELSFVDTLVSPGITYYYSVSAANGSGEGAPSGAVGAEPGPNPPEVFFIAEKNVVGTRELFVVDRSGAVRNLSGPLVPGGNVRFMRASWDGQWMAFTADKDEDEVLELYVVPVAGGTPVKVSGPLVAGGDVFFVPVWAPDSSRILYLADAEVDEQFELYTALPTGGTPVRLTDPMVAGGDVPLFKYAWAEGGSRVVYAADQNVDDAFEAFSVPAAGGPALNLTQAIGPNAIVADLAVSWDGTQVALSAKADVAAATQLYAVPAGGGAAVTLSGGLPGGVRNTPSWSYDSTRCAFVEGNDLYTANADGSGRVRISTDSPVQPGGFWWGPGDAFVLYHSFFNGEWRNYTAVPGVAGSEVNVSDPIAIGDDATGINNAPTGSRLLYTKGGGAKALYTTTSGVAGGGTQISGSPGWGVDVRMTFWSPDATRIAYSADEDLDGFEEFYSVPEVGGTRVKLSGALLESGIFTGAWSGDGSRVYFVACKDAPGTLELYSTGPEGGPITRLSGAMVSGGRVVSILPAP